ncbi:hypothetical protein COLO4_04949 [Corchorus olitorius]|uniref:Uncharacterized protein n=1 Tax=Corchorus olitorius TaxID=93759 RepID=A0A1R3KSB5_9ROSI|nr:hypothetical protein COLO4_04949 [Corchorus olitorius]
MEEQAAQIQQLKQSQEEMRYSQEEMRQEQGVIKEQLSVIMGMLQRLSGEKAPTQAQEQKIAVISEIDTTVVTSGIETENCYQQQQAELLCLVLILDLGLHMFHHH